ncbi:MAG: hypothetical protein HQL52_16010 [Magnetococcales bacterium]|nr:hypothetical protein [Magnetococcales bacterium]
MSWRPIKRSWGLIGLYLVIIGVGWGYHQELLWGWRNLPKYMDDRIGAGSHEGRLLRSAKKRLRRGVELEEALIRVEEALGIDPNLAAAYLLKGDLLKRLGEGDRAARAWQQGLGIDPFQRKGYERLVQFYLQGRELDQARRVYQEGIRTFARLVQGNMPHRDPGVARAYNRKALQVREAAVQDWTVLKLSLARLERLERQWLEESFPFRISR